MTATPLASGTALKCDAPRCTRPATVDKDVWSFCDEHANEKPTPAPVRTAPRPAPMPATTTLTVTAPAAPSPIGVLLEQASGHSNARVRRLGEKIEKHLDDLRTLVRVVAADEQRKQAEKAAKTQARAEVERLEQQLAAAKAKLRGGQPAAATTTPPPASDPDAKTCKDCGSEIVRPPGQPGRAPSRCTDCKAKA